MVAAMVRATCALCGASNSVMRVYLGMQHPRPNLLALSCKQCGKVSSQLRTLGDYLTFSVIYSAITLPLVILGMHLIGHVLETGWVATIAAVIPFTFLPAWWANRRADQYAQGIPREDISNGRKVLFLLVALGLIGGWIAGGLLIYLVYIAGD